MGSTSQLVPGLRCCTKAKLWHEKLIMWSPWRGCLRAFLLGPNPPFTDNSLWWEVTCRSLVRKVASNQGWNQAAGVSGAVWQGTGGSDYSEMWWRLTKDAKRSLISGKHQTGLAPDGCLPIMGHVLHRSTATKGISRGQQAKAELEEQSTDQRTKAERARQMESQRNKSPVPRVRMAQALRLTGCQATDSTKYL